MLKRRVVKIKSKKSKLVSDLIRGINNKKSKPKLYLLEGDKVKLNIKKMKSHPSYNKYNDKFKSFLEDNKDKIFTVEYDKTKKNKPNLVCLKEDDSKYKWLFWDGDLLVLDENDNKFKELYLINLAE